MEIIQFIVGIVVMLVGIFVIVMNWVTVFHWIVKRKHSSWIPLLGGALAAIGVGMIPVPQFNGYWYVPLLLDWGCLGYAVYSIVNVFDFRERQ